MTRNSSTQQQTGGERDTASEGFLIDELILEDRRTILVLNKPKDGSNQIVFELGERQALANMLVGLFQSGKAFDFQIVQKLGGGQCKINRLHVRFGA